MKRIKNFFIRLIKRFGKKAISIMLIVVLLFSCAAIGIYKENKESEAMFGIDDLTIGGYFMSALLGGLGAGASVNQMMITKEQAGITDHASAEQYVKNITENNSWFDTVFNYTSEFLYQFQQSMIHYIENDNNTYVLNDKFLCVNLPMYTGGSVDGTSALKDVPLDQSIRQVKSATIVKFPTPNNDDDDDSDDDPDNDITEVDEDITAENDVLPDYSIANAPKLAIFGVYATIVKDILGRDLDFNIDENTPNRSEKKYTLEYYKENPILLSWLRDAGNQYGGQAFIFSPTLLNDIYISRYKDVCFIPCFIYGNPQHNYPGYFNILTSKELDIYPDNTNNSFVSIGKHYIGFTDYSFYLPDGHEYKEKYRQEYLDNLEQLSDSSWLVSNCNSLTTYALNSFGYAMNISNDSYFGYNGYPNIFKYYHTINFDAYPDYKVTNNLLMFENEDAFNVFKDKVRNFGYIDTSSIEELYSIYKDGGWIYHDKSFRDSDSEKIKDNIKKPEVKEEISEAGQGTDNAGNKKPIRGVTVDSVVEAVKNKPSLVGEMVGKKPHFYPPEIVPNPNPEIEPSVDPETAPFTPTVVPNVNPNPSGDPYYDPVNDPLNDVLSIPVVNPNPKPWDEPDPQETDSPDNTPSPSKPPNTSEIMLPETSNINWYERFPFCIPWDLYNAVKVLDAKTKAPSWDVPLDIDKVNVHEEVHIDFKDFEGIRDIVRWFLRIIFIGGLVVISRNLIKG